MGNDKYGSDKLFLDYHLPSERIAQSPIEPRDSSRLLVVERGAGRLSDHIFRDLPELLDEGDLLVVNDSRVVPARIHVRRASGGRVELLLLEKQGDDLWTALARPLARLRSGEILTVDGTKTDGDAKATGIQFVERRGSLALVRVDSENLINEIGQIPLPPYIHEDLTDSERYQTIYSKTEGSAAAPTAGLHFTPELLERCREKGIGVESVTLHVGLDTFRPLEGDDPDLHQMHSERFSISPASWRAIQSAQAAGKRIVSVGTTTTRVLETVGLSGRTSPSLSGRTDIFIRPPFEFQIVGAQITNFHLPRTTLLLMIDAFAGSALLKRAYQHAIDQQYRFYSFGDAMLIV